MRPGLAAFVVLLSTVLADPALAEAPGGGDGSGGEAVPVTLGVGSLRLDFDGSNVAFDFVRYLKKQPLRVKGRLLEAHLVDFATDADFTVSGKVTGQVFISNPTPFGGNLIWLETFGPLGGLLVGSVVAGIGAIGGTASLLVLGAAIAAAGIVVVPVLAVLATAIATAGAWSPTEFGTLQLQLRRSGAAAGTLTGSAITRPRGACSAEAALDRETYLDAVFDEASKQLARQLEGELR